MFVKHLLFQSKTEYHAGNQAQADRKYGLKLARLEVREIASFLFSNIFMLLFFN
jgi:hypothetical protein